MIKVYSVQTFTGCREKTFQRLHNAVKYAQQLSKELPDDDIELTPINVTDEDFTLLDIDD